MKEDQKYSIEYWPMVSILVVLFLLSINLTFAAEDPAKFPSRPITMVVQWAPGGSTDVTGRKLGELAGKILGQPVIVENKSGGSGVIAANAVAKAPPDGYTIGTVSAGATVTIPHFRKVPYDGKKDFTYLMQYSAYPEFFCVLAEKPWKTMRDFIEDARRNPGKLTIANTGPKAGPHLCVAAMTQIENVNVNHVPTKGGAEVITQLLGGHADAGTCAEFGPHIRARKVRALAVQIDERLADLPNVPTFGELGYGTGCPQIWVGLYGPAGLPPVILRKFQVTFKKAYDDPSFKELLDSFMMLPIYKDTDPFTKMVNEDFDNKAKIIKQLGWKE